MERPVGHTHVRTTLVRTRTMVPVWQSSALTWSTPGVILAFQEPECATYWPWHPLLHVSHHSFPAKEGAYVGTAGGATFCAWNPQLRATSRRASHLPGSYQPLYGRVSLCR